MMKELWLVQVSEDEYETCPDVLGCSKSKQRGLEMIKEWCTKQSRQKRFLVETDGKIRIEEITRKWSDEAIDYVDDADNWHYWGVGYIDLITVDQVI